MSALEGLRALLEIAQLQRPAGALRIDSWRSGGHVRRDYEVLRVGHLSAWLLGWIFGF